MLDGKPSGGCADQNRKKKVGANFEEGHLVDDIVSDSERLGLVNLAAVLHLAELSVLLREYAPSWYTAEQRNRVLAAWRLATDVLLELCALLEDYAPSWYTEQQRDRALGVVQALGLLEQPDRKS
jgi:hypothetical protein